MNQKDLIKYGLIALGAYLVWKYVQDHGGIDGLLGTVPVATGMKPAINTGSTGASTGSTDTHTNTIQPVPPTPPVLDMAGLMVTPDVNDSLSGTVKINGVPVRFSIITSDGRIFGAAGTDLTQSLQSSGVDVVALRTAFQAAPQVSARATGESLSGLGRAPYWLN